MAPRMLAIYGKGGMGKSFFTSNLTATLGLRGAGVLQLGCDPKHDSCNTLFGGRSLPTLGERYRLAKEQGREDAMSVGDVVFRTRLSNQRWIYGCELGGPEVGRGCGGTGIASGFKLLEGLGMSKWSLDYVVMDFLGDVVCGGFATPLARSLAEEVIIVVGHDRQSLYAANNISRAAKYFRDMGGTTNILGLVVNRDDGSDTADKYAAATGLPILARIPLSRTVRELADACRLALEDPQFKTIFDELGDCIAKRTIPPCTDYEPLEYDQFLRTFGAEEPAGLPDPATHDDLFGSKAAPSIFVGTIPLTLVSSVPPPVDPMQLRLQEVFGPLGYTVGKIEQRPKQGLTIAADGVEVCLGDESDIEQKAAFLAALRRTGQQVEYVDLRYVDAPFFR
ncbi:MAG: chlorophyllide a reductase iron protein subunit X [Herpetosiphonaceae bacterium]|nr:chlorophyllide a reductase iron protein subunit X [Herpetosiphonaceae bacterium]